MPKKNVDTTVLMTDEELAEAGISRELFDDWYRILTALYSVLKKTWKDEVLNPENTIVIAHWTIAAKWINNSYIEIEVRHHDIEMLSIRYRDNLRTVVECVLSVITNGKGELIGD